jgi:hypothetical protein
LNFYENCRNSFPPCCFDNNYENDSTQFNKNIIHYFHFLKRYRLQVQSVHDSNVYLDSFYRFVLSRKYIDLARVYREN